MKTFLAFVLPAFGFGLPLHGQVVQGMSGKFYVSVDDSAVVFLNGKEVFRASFTKKERVQTSETIDLKVGDQLVFQLNNVGGPKGLMAQFVSADQKTIIHFPRGAYKRLVNPLATTFAPAEYRDGPSVKDVKHPFGDKILPFKSRSEWVWGENQTCALASVITREHLSAVAR